MVTNTHLSENSELEEQRRLLDKAIEYFRQQDGVVGLFLGGSIAFGSPDRFSDIDLYVVARDENFDEIFAKREHAAKSIGRPLSWFIADHNPGGDRDLIVLYEQGIKVDFMYWKVSETPPGPKWSKQQVVFDRNDVLSDVHRQSQEVTWPQPSKETMVTLDHKFWTWCWVVSGRIARGELWDAVDFINFIRGQALIRMLDWAQGRTFEGHRRLELKISPELALSFDKTMPKKRTADDLFQALQAEIDLYNELKKIVVERYHLVLDQELPNYVQETVTNLAHH